MRTHVRLEMQEMTKLSDAARAEIRERLTHMIDPVHLLVFTDRGCPTCDEMVTLFRDMAEVSRHIRLELIDPDLNALLAARYGIDKTPAVALLKGGVEIVDTRIRFFGTFGEDELPALVDNIVAVSTRTL